MRYFFAIFTFMIILTVSILGIRGKRFEEPPLYIFPDMDFQAKYLPQGKNDFFEDKRNDRPVVPNTIERGYAWDKDTLFSKDYHYDQHTRPEFYTGKTSTGEFYRGFPLEVNHSLMLEGKKKFTIFCQVCHGASGDGNGITKQYGMSTTASYHDDRLRDMAEGEIFNTITHGKNTMNPYGDKLTPHERWAIILYVRALQRAQNASPEDVPFSQRSTLGL